MRYLLVVVAFFLASCVSVWPDQCHMNYRGKTTCTCNKIPPTFRVKNHTQVTLECDGIPLPLEVSGTGVRVEKN